MWIGDAISGKLQEMRKIHKHLASHGLQGELKNWKDTYGDTALMKATRHGHYKICKWLVAENLVDENAQNNGGWNALHLAADHNRPEIARLLLKETSIDINEQTNAGLTGYWMTGYRRTALDLAWKPEVKRILELEIYFSKNKGKPTNY